MKIKNNGALTIVRKVPKNGRAKGILSKNNLAEAVKNGKNNIVVGMNKKV